MNHHRRGDRPVNSTCQACQAPLLWAITPAGRRIPIDAEPADDGNVLLDTTARPSLTAHVLGPGLAARCRDRGDRLHKPHFATCPHADLYRRRPTLKRAHP